MNNILMAALPALAFPAFAAATEQHTLNRMNTLTPSERNIASISAHAAIGDMPGLAVALEQGLDAGLEMEQIKEILVQLYAYCGFPRSLNALGSLMEVARHRAERGIADAPGRMPGPLPAGTSIEFGTANQTKLCGGTVTGELFTFAPAIDTFLKAHLFGDIFGRDNVDWKTRELATIAALAAMSGTESQLEAHIRIGKHNGLGEPQIDAAVTLARSLAQQDAFPKGEAAPAHFSGVAHVAMLCRGTGDTDVYNVTFAPGTRNDWHRHSVGQILLCTHGTGYYQERGRSARKLEPGNVVSIPADTWHWHGAGPSGVFVHIGITPKSSENQTEWGEPVDEADYDKAVQTSVKQTTHQ